MDRRHAVRGQPLCRPLRRQGWPDREDGCLERQRRAHSGPARDRGLARPFVELRFKTGLRCNWTIVKRFALFKNSVLRKKIPLASAGGRGFMVSNKKLNRRKRYAGRPAMGKRDVRVVASADCRDRGCGSDRLLRTPGARV